MRTDLSPAATGGPACPCGSGTDLANCCGRFLGRHQQAGTAEELMRSRYTAYVVGDIDYLLATHDPETVAETDREGLEQWSRSAVWHGLVILATERGAADDDEGVVEFAAKYSSEGVMRTHSERSRFRKRRGRWLYVDGEMGKATPVVRGAAKTGRNDPCPCGSGKKYKKCCGR